MDGVFLDARTLLDLSLEPLERLFKKFTCYEGTQSDDVLPRSQRAEVLIVNKILLDRKRLEQLDRLRLICLVATGADNIDLAAAGDLGITVCNCRAYGTDSVVQHVLGMMLALHTRLLDYAGDVRQGRWQQANQFCFLDHPIVELKGKTLGIVGYGTLGRGVAKIAEAFGMRILLADRPGAGRYGRIPLIELLPKVDVLSLHCPLTAETRNLINREMLALMKPTAFLINAARGGIVDEAALAEALKNGRLAGAGVDVLSQEPPTDDNPLLDPKIPNLLITPHAAWGSIASRQRIIDQTVENIREFIKGEPIRKLV